MKSDQPFCEGETFGKAHTYIEGQADPEEQGQTDPEPADFTIFGPISHHNHIYTLIGKSNLRARSFVS